MDTALVRQPRVSPAAASAGRMARTALAIVAVAAPLGGLALLQPKVEIGLFPDRDAPVAAGEPATTPPAAAAPTEVEAAFNDLPIATQPPNPPPEPAASPPASGAAEAAPPPPSRLVAKMPGFVARQLQPIMAAARSAPAPAPAPSAPATAPETTPTPEKAQRRALADMPAEKPLIPPVPRGEAVPDALPASRPSLPLQTELIGPQPPVGAGPGQRPAPADRHG